jgi:hypothetical protein
MKKKLLVLLFIFNLMIPSVVLAQDSSASAEVSFKKESVNPDSFIYPIKRFSEKIEEYFSSFGAVQTQNFQKKIAQIRLKELMYVAQNKSYSQFKDSSSRYVTMLQKMIESKNVPTEDERKMISEQIANLKKLQQKYDGDYAYWSFLQQAIETSQNYMSLSH